MKILKFLVIFSLLFSIGLSCSEGEKVVKEETKKQTKSKEKEEEKAKVPKITLCERLSKNEIIIELKSKFPELTKEMLVVSEYDTAEPVNISDVEVLKGGKNAKIILSSELAIDKNYNVGIISDNKTNYMEAQFSDEFWNNNYISSKPLGCNYENGEFVFRVFSPRAVKVLLCLFDKPYEFNSQEEWKKGNPKFEGEKNFEMVKDSDGVWEYKIKENLWGKLYGYRVFGPKGGSENFNPNVIVADPYSKAIATKQVSPQHHLTVIIDPSKYKWETKEKFAPVKRREAIIYEMHVRDMTMLSPNVEKKGTYEGLVEEGKIGGIEHIKELGVNIVELLPTHEFDDIEEPYREKGYANTWNTYGKNHWGYMTTCYFAPESFYYKGKMEAGNWIGVDGGQVYAFKKMVDKFHKNGIGVMMDVVYNHVSQYDRNPLKFIDKKYYFWLNAFGSDDSRSGCGNDLKSDRPMARRLIVDSVKYWVEEYRIDGFRFDLGTIIDWKTYETLVPILRGINPECHLTAEPWMGGRGEPRDGGGYALIDNKNGFDMRDIGAWNDKFRILVRNEGNLVFGGASIAELKNAVLVYPKLFKNPANSFNYIESHDNNTFSDLIRLGNKEVKKDKPVITNYSSPEIIEAQYLELCKLNEKSLKQNKLGALFLLTVQGPVMLHEGQEFARMKVVYPPSGESVYPPNSANWKQDEKGKWFDGNKPWSGKVKPWLIDHDSYEKDNECNWINWKLKDINRDLFEYYKGLIKIRKENPAFSTMDVTKIQFIEPKIPGDPKGKPKSAIGYIYDKQFSKDTKSFVILVNGSWTDLSFTLPDGEWNVLADGESASVKDKKLSGEVIVPQMTGMILCQ